jgi:hypothetical protein
LRLNGNIKRGNRLIRHDEARINGNGARDADTLALTAGELPRIAIHVAGRQADLGQKLRDTFPLFRAAAHDTEGLERFSDDIGDAAPRAQRSVRILKHHLGLPAHLPHLTARE